MLLGPEERVHDIVEWIGALPLANRELEVSQRKKAGITVGVFALAILAASTGLVYLPIALALACVAFVALGVVRGRQLYESVEWPVIVLLGSMITTMTLSDVLNNTATTIIAAPVGVSIAMSLGVSPDPFLMAVAVSASCAFLTPIGHKNNTLILGPGGYRFGDYWRMGLPLEALVVAVGVPSILWVWPL